MWVVRTQLRLGAIALERAVHSCSAIRGDLMDMVVRRAVLYCAPSVRTFSSHMHVPTVG